MQRPQLLQLEGNQIDRVDVVLSDRIVDEKLIGYQVTVGKKVEGIKNVGIVVLSGCKIMVSPPFNYEDTRGFIYKTIRDKPRITWSDELYGSSKEYAQAIALCIDANFIDQTKRAKKENLEAKSG